MPCRVIKSAHHGRQKGAAGFTLVETMMAVGIFAIIAVGVTLLLRSSQRAHASNLASTETKSEITLIQQRLNRYFRQRKVGTAGTISAGGSVFTIERTGANLSTTIFPTSTFTTACVSTPKGIQINSAGQQTLASMARVSCTNPPCPVCLQCGTGQMPQIFFKDQETGTAMTFPTAKSGSVQRPVAASICFEPEATPAGKVNVKANISMALIAPEADQSMAMKVSVVQTPVELSVSSRDTNVQILK